MITKTTQNWSIGNTVSVGFLRLKIVDICGSTYKLESTKGIAYEFTPYTGIVRISQ